MKIRNALFQTGREKESEIGRFVPEIASWVVADKLGHVATKLKGQRGGLLHLKARKAISGWNSLDARYIYIYILVSRI